MAALERPDPALVPPGPPLPAPIPGEPDLGLAALFQVHGLLSQATPDLFGLVL